MNTAPDGATHKIQGLDPRALLARARRPDQVPARVAWKPPSIEDLTAVLPAFTVEALIGRGGMGAVYRARQPALDRVVAIKLLPGLAAEDEEFAERFRTEARALARLQHPHIVTIHESGETAEGSMYYVMEYVDGSDLSERLAGGPLPAAEALSIARAVCEALEYAHARGIIHRDIKPANVLLGKDGSVKVADFGLAKQFGAAADKESTGIRCSDAMLTQTGAALGTPSYMSPEQRAGREVDGRADLYSLGVMLYEMLTGDLPQGAWQPPSRKSDSSPRLDAVVEKTVQQDPALRVQSAAELRARLDRIVRSTSPGARRRRLLLKGLTALAFAVAAGWLWSWLQRPPAPSLSEDAGNPSRPGDLPLSLTPPGIVKPLDGLDLPSVAVVGQWSWQDGGPGGTLSIAYTHGNHASKVLLLPVHPGPSRGYDLRCEVLLEHRGADLTFVLPAGKARPAFVLELYDTSGLEYIRGTDWMKNETTVTRTLPYARFFPLALTVRPVGERVAITGQLDGQPFFQWEGPQSDLSLPIEQYPIELLSRDGPVLALLSKFGGASLRALEVNILP